MTEKPYLLASEPNWKRKSKNRPRPLKKYLKTCFTMRSPRRCHSSQP